MTVYSPTSSSRANSDYPSLAFAANSPAYD